MDRGRQTPERRAERRSVALNAGQFPDGLHTLGWRREHFSLRDATGCRGTVSCEQMGFGSLEGEDPCIRAVGVGGKAGHPHIRRSVWSPKQLPAPGQFGRGCFFASRSDWQGQQDLDSSLGAVQQAIHFCLHHSNRWSCLTTGQRIRHRGCGSLLAALRCFKQCHGGMSFGDARVQCECPLKQPSCLRRVRVENQLRQTQRRTRVGTVQFHRVLKPVNGLFVLACHGRSIGGALVQARKARRQCGGYAVCLDRGREFFGRIAHQPFPAKSQRIMKMDSRNHIVHTPVTLGCPKQFSGYDRRIRRLAQREEQFCSIEPTCDVGDRFVGRLWRVPTSNARHADSGEQDRVEEPRRYHALMSMVHSNASLPRSYSPAETEPAIRSMWQEAGLGHIEVPEPGTECYSIVIPPPNVTAALHLGHALNNTLQDILVRYHRMRGATTLWLPGTDHAGIATQTVVEKRLMQSGKRRTDMSREDFVALTQEWKDEYEQVILGQLQELGASCDWPRTRFTMDPVCTAAVRHAFFCLFQDGLIERGKRLVNWDPATQTALADDEVEMEEVDGHMWYLRYPLEDGSGHVTVATTRPETMLGDTAVAMNPSDPRAAELRGKFITLPIANRRIPIVEDEYVIMAGDGDDPKAQYATGFLKVTPAHDPNDWDIGQRHDLEAINIMGPDGSISDRHGWDDVCDEARPFIGLSREDAREAVVEWFRGAGLLEDIRDYAHSVGHSYRSHVPIEPWLSDQWYVRVSDDRLCGEALRAMSADQIEGDPPPREIGKRKGDGGISFTPARYARTFQHWHENLRDWCISRQLWWGHRIPVWTLECPLVEGLPEDPLSLPPAGCSLPMCETQDSDLCVRLSVNTAESVVRILACVDRERSDLEQQLEAAGFTQDPDVLDTWFSSALWPMSTMGWPDASAFPETEGLLDAFNPTNVLCTAREIITLWVSRMVMFNRYFLDGRIPFKDVYIHPMVQDGHGQKMSKSLGNGVDPRDIIHSHGTDALRFVMAQIATETQDVRLPVDTIDPHSGETFSPKYITTATGKMVAAPIQTSPTDSACEMVTVYGVYIGETPSEERPLAKNTSSRFDVGRNFANKVWNAARFAMGRVECPEPVTDLGTLSLSDRWMLSRIAAATSMVGEAIEQYRFNPCVDAIYDIFWRDFCDWYLEAVKPTIGSDPAQQRVCLTVLDALLRLMHPLCPFVTEAIWPHVRSLGERGVPGLSLPDSDLLAVAAWPDVADTLHSDSAERETARLQALVASIRRVRSDNDVPAKANITLLSPPGLLDLASDSAAVLASMCRVEFVKPRTEERPAGALAFAMDGEEVLLDLAGAIDTDAEQARLQAKADDLGKKVASMQARLSNESYVQKAPPHLVEETRTQLQQAEADLEATTAAIEALG